MLVESIEKNGLSFSSYTTMIGLVRSAAEVGQSAEP